MTESHHVVAALAPGQRYRWSTSRPGRPVDQSPVASSGSPGASGAGRSTRLLMSLLYRVTPLDPLTFSAVAAVLIAAAAGAIYLPARRATRISAAAALRAE